MKKIALSQGTRILDTNNKNYIAYNGKLFRVNQTIAILLKELQLPVYLDDVLANNPLDASMTDEGKKLVKDFFKDLLKMGILTYEDNQDCYIKDRIFQADTIIQGLHIGEILSNDDPFIQVYKVYNTTRQIPSVIKMFQYPPAGIINKKIQYHYELFCQEIEVTRSIPAHKHICQYIADGELDGYRYLELEYIDGTTLSRFLQTNQTASFEEKLFIAQQVLKAMAFIHVQDMIHGDIHTRNFMVNAQLHTTLIDFGFSFHLQQPHHIRNKGGLAHYLPPERVHMHAFMFSKGHATKSAEVYQIGLVLLKLFTGKNPFLTDQESTWQEMAGRILAYSPTSGLVADAHLDRILCKALANDPAQRYASCQEMFIDFTNPC